MIQFGIFNWNVQRDSRWYLDKCDSDTFAQVAMRTLTEGIRPHNNR